MKDSLKLFIALALIAAGVFWALVILGVLNLEFSTKGWWALFIIVPCIFGLFNDKDKTGPCIGIALGVLLLLAARGVITWSMMWQLFLAILVVLIGVSLLLNKSCGRSGNCDVKTVSREGKNIRRIEASFGKQSITFAGETFEGADVQASFGALILDLNGAEIIDGASIDLNAGFCGVTIIVPDSLAVKIAVNSGFGGVTDNRRSKIDSGTPLLFITGKVGFGGVEIRN